MTYSKLGLKCQPFSIHPINNEICITQIDEVFIEVFDRVVSLFALMRLVMIDCLNPT